MSNEANYIIGIKERLSVDRNRMPNLNIKHQFNHNMNKKSEIPTLKEVSEMTDNEVIELYMSNYKKYMPHLERVADWNKRFMRPQLSEPGIPPEHLWKLRIKLLREEVQELEDAYMAGDVIGVLDAQLDIAVVNLGGVAEAGLTEVYDLGFEEVMRANDSKADKDGNPILRPEDGKIMKSDLYTPPNLTKFFKI